MIYRRITRQKIVEQTRFQIIEERLDGYAPASERGVSTKYFQVYANDLAGYFCNE